LDKSCIVDDLIQIYVDEANNEYSTLFLRHCPGLVVLCSQSFVHSLVSGRYDVAVVTLLLTWSASRHAWSLPGKFAIRLPFFWIWVHC